MDKVMYDLSNENLKTIQSLIATEQHRLIKAGLFNTGPAYYKACENVGKMCIVPAIGASELATWVGKLAGKHAADSKKPRVFNSIPLEFPVDLKARVGQLRREDVGKPTRSYEVKIVEGLTPPVFGAHSSQGEGPKWQEAWKVIHDAPVGEWKAIRLADYLAAIRCQTSCNTYAKKVLHCIENGWKLRSKIDKTQQDVLWLIKVSTT